MGSKRFSTPPNRGLPQGAAARELLTGPAHSDALRTSGAPPHSDFQSGNKTIGQAALQTSALELPQTRSATTPSRLMQALKSFTQRFSTTTASSSTSSSFGALLPILPADLFRAEQANQVPNKPQRLGVRMSHPLAQHYGEVAYQALNKGDALRLRDQIEPAIVQYTFALSQDSQLAEAHAGLGHCHRRVGNIPRAIESFKRALAINPFLKFAQLDLAKSYTDLGKLTLAKKHYQTAIKLIPTWIEARFGLALLLETEEDFLPAVDQYEQILQEDPNFLPAIHNLGHLHYRIGNYPMAIQQFENSLTVAPGFPRALLGLAMALEKNEQLREALTAYHQLLAVRPNSHQLEFIKTRMSQLHEVLGRPTGKARKRRRKHLPETAFADHKIMVSVDDKSAIHLVRIK